MGVEQRGRRASRIGRHALRYLTEQPHVGRVVSRFRCGLNVLLDGSADPGFVSIQTRDVALHPWGVEIPGGEGDVSVGAPCRVEAGVLCVHDSIEIDVEEAAVANLEISLYSVAQAARAREQLVTLGDFRNPSFEAMEVEIGSILAQWRACGDPTDLSDLVGLGSGSTPAGDDTFVGLVAGLTAFGGSVQCLRRIDTRSRTTLPSAQMIEAALDGSFPEPLCDLVNALPICTDEELGNLASSLEGLGSTSGRMMLRGLIAALG